MGWIAFITTMVYSTTVTHEWVGILSPNRVSFGENLLRTGDYRGSTRPADMYRATASARERTCIFS